MNTNEENKAPKDLEYSYIEAYIGEIKMFAGNFAPEGWAFCNGQLKSISQHSALYSLLGTTYGGNGSTTFALPDLRGRFPMHYGMETGPGLTPKSLGEMAGVESVTLISNQMPQHTHVYTGKVKIKVADTNGNTSVANANSLAKKAGDIDTGAALEIYNSNPTYVSNFELGGVENTGVISPSGGGTPHNNMPPYLCVNFIICMEGLYPSRP